MMNTITAALALMLFGTAQAAAEVRIGLATEITGKTSWLGEQDQRGFELAVVDLNDAGGVLSQTLEVVIAEDPCDAEQAVAAARKLIAHSVVAVVGHGCSGAAIAASSVYEEAGVVMISPTAINPKLTDQGFRHVFRMVARDTLQAAMAGEYLAEESADGRIAIFHDGSAYGQGLAEETKRQLNARAVQEVLFEQTTPGQTDYTTDLARLETADVDVLFYGGYEEEAALLIRQARSAGYDMQMIGSDALVTAFSGSWPGRRRWA
ncbi:MAG TPA: branched-chain amino acid ABC transporter substrate-binding protein [Geminicoccaceae bacterium]|nr:branched-chain amino acid ABC transporter substrate-binding protein [Geminicoccaceae bacterium]